VARVDHEGNWRGNVRYVSVGTRSIVFKSDVGLSREPLFEVSIPQSAESIAASGQWGKSKVGLHITVGRESLLDIGTRAEICP
jgi:hypothetical protein